MKRLAITLVALLLLIPFSLWFAKSAGFLKQVEQVQKTEESAPDSQPWWHEVKRPASFDVAIDDVDDQFESVLQAAAPAIAQAQDAIDEIPEAERYTIPNGPDVPLEEEAQIAFRRYLEQFVDAYRERTADTGETRRLGEEFLVSYVDCWAALEPAPDFDAIAQQGKDAIEAGSQDPLIVAVYTQISPAIADSEADKLATLDECANQLETQGYSAAVMMTVRLLAWQLDRDLGLSRASEARRYRVVESAVRFLANEAGQPASRFVWWQLYCVFAELDEAGRRALYAGALMNGKYNEFAMHMMAGRLYQDAAWASQGSESVNAIADAGSERFRGLMSRARRHYSRAWLLEPAAPEPSTALIEVVTAGGEDRWNARDWFHVATRAEIDANHAYSLLLWSMKPRWGGNHQQMLSFAHKCLDTERWDTTVPAYSFAILRQIHEDFGSGFGKLPGILEVVNGYVIGAQRAKASGVQLADVPSTNWALAAALYAQAGHYEEAHAVFHSFGDRMSQREFNWTRSKLTYQRGLCAAMTGPANADLPALREQIEGTQLRNIAPGQIDELIAEVGRLRVLDGREVVQPYWDDLAATLTHLQTYHRGEWVELHLDENLSGLSLTADKYEVTGDGTLRMASTDDSDGAVLHPLAWFEPPLLVEGEFAGWDEHPTASNWGISVPWSGHDRGGTREVVLTHGRNVILVIDLLFASFRPAYTKVQLDPAGPKFHRLRMKLWPQEAHHSWEGGRLYVDREFDANISGRVYFGGIHSAMSNSGQMRNLRVRKLNYDPPPEDATDRQLRDYWQRELEFDPQDVEAHIQLSAALRNLEEPVEGERELRAAREVNPDVEGIPYLLAVTLVDQERFADAIAELEQAVQADLDIRVPGFLSWILSTVEDESLRDPQRALNLAERAQLRRPGHWETFRAMASAHARLGNYDQAADWMRQAITAREMETHDEKSVAKLRGYLETIEAGEAIVDQPGD